MKKIKKILLGICLFCLFSPLLNAEEIEVGDIPNSTYVIGKYMFTRNANEDDGYSGTLTTQLIMLAAKSIEGDSLDDMVIYYKNARGNWVDPLSGTAVSVESTFEIEKVDLSDDEINYTISYNLNGGTADNITVYSGESENYTLVNPTKDGYVFVGWTGSNGNTPQETVTIANTMRGNLTYTANWVLAGDVDNNGSINNQDVTLLTQYLNGEDVTIDNNASDVDGDGVIDSADLLVLTRKVAEWDINLVYTGHTKYTVSFNLNGGETEEYINAYYSELLVGNDYTITNPTKNGYVFAGWTGSNGNTAQETIKITSSEADNLTYTANWIKYGDVDNNGSINNQDTTLLTQYLNGEDVTINTINSDLDCDGVIDYADYLVLVEKVYEGDITLPYTGHTKYTITYNLDGAETEEYRNAYYSEIPTDFTITNPTKEGYIFKGWTGSNGNTPQTWVRISTDVAANLTYNANWEVDSGILGDVNDDGIVDNQDITVMREYVFGTTGTGINETAADVDCDGDVDCADIQVLTRKLDGWDITLPYTGHNEVWVLYYNFSGRSFEENNIEEYYPELLGDDGYTLINPTKEGYVFVGWTGSNGDTPQKTVTITSDTTITPKRNNPGGQLRYYSNWALDSGEEDETYVAKVDNMYYTSLSSAIEASSATYPAVLLSDYTLTSREVLNVANKELVLDLNGKTLSMSNSSSTTTRIQLEGSTKLTIKNGTISSTSGYALAAFDSSTLTINSDVTVNVSGSSDGAYGVFVRQSATVNLYGTINATKTGSAQDAFGISGNGTDHEQSTTINIYEGANITSNGAALYLPQLGTTNITGGTLEGNTVIGIKAGSLNISGGTLTATGEQTVPTKNNNGMSYTGDVVYIEENNSYADSVQVNMTGGTLNTTNGYIIGEFNSTLGTDNELTSTVSGLYAVKNTVEDTTNRFYYTAE